MISKCVRCNKEIEHENTGNMIIFCPYCRKSIGSISDYGFGPIVPCDIFLGDKIIASIPSMNELVSEEFGIRKTLCGKYAQLQIYKEAEEIIDELLNK